MKPYILTFLVLFVVVLSGLSALLTGDPLSWIDNLGCLIHIGNFGVCLLSCVVVRPMLHPCIIQTTHDINTMVNDPDDTYQRDTTIPAGVELRAVRTHTGKYYLGQPGYDMILLDPDEYVLVSPL